MGRLAGFVVKGVRDQRKNGEVWHPELAHNGNLQINIFLSFKFICDQCHFAC